MTNTVGVGDCVSWQKRKDSDVIAKHDHTQHYQHKK
jgi:hypothetical protein